MESDVNTLTKRHKDLYQVILDAIPSSVLLIAKDMRIASVNRNFLEKNKRTKEETINRRFQEVFLPSILDNLEITRRVQTVFETNKATPGERMTYRAPGGLMRIYYYRIFPLRRNGAVESVLLLMDDVTEQTQLSEEIRRMERHLSVVVESASEIVLSTDSSGTILSWNQAAEQISGYAPGDVLCHAFHEFCAREHQSEVKRVFSEMKLQKRPRATEWNLIPRSGCAVPVSWTCSPMIDDQGGMIGIVATGRDLTESRKLEAQLLQAQKLAALGVMAGGIAHEIRNPLAICSSAAQFLMEDSVNPELLKECACKIHAGIRRCAAIIENLLKVARPTAPGDMTQLKLVPIVRETLGSIARQAESHGIEVATRFPRRAVVIQGVDSLLRQVFANLFLNAINAMPEGGRLEVTVEAEARQVEVRTVDNGAGIPANEVGNIFDPFYTRSRTGKGVGLGLTLCYFIIKQHAGSIEVDSVEGKGSAFTIRLPLSDGPKKP